MSHELAKRGLGKNKKDYTLKDIYKAYKDEHKNDPFKLDEKAFRRIVLYFNKRTIQLILEEGRTFILPFRMGIIRIRKHKQNYNEKLKIDFAESRKYKKTIYHMNDHSDGYYYRFYLNDFGSNAQNKSLYSFMPSRQNARRLAYLIKTRKLDYYL